MNSLLTEQNSAFCNCLSSCKHAKICILKLKYSVPVRNTSFTENCNWVFVLSGRILVPAGYWATYYNHHVIKDITCVGRSFQQLIYGKLPDCIDRIKLSVVLGYPPVSVDISNFFNFFFFITVWWRSIFLTCKSQKRCWFYCLFKYLLSVRIN